FPLTRPRALADPACRCLRGRGTQRDAGPRSPSEPTRRGSDSDGELRVFAGFAFDTRGAAAHLLVARLAADEPAGTKLLQGLLDLSPGGPQEGAVGGGGAGV